MLSRRVPADLEANEWTQRLVVRRSTGAALIDLTDQNPTRSGLSVAGEEWAVLADPRGTRYEPDPSGLATARAAISAYYLARGLNVEMQDLVLTPGTSDAYSYLFRALCDPGDTVLVPAPGYPLLQPLAALDAIELVTYPLDPDAGWRPDLVVLERRIGPRTRAVVVVQPNHPTGSCFDSGEIEALDALCAGRDVGVISDEVFGDFLWDDTGRPVGPAPSLLGPRAAPTFALQGLSKLCGLPQLKLSWIALAGPAAARHAAGAALEWIADAYLSVGTPVQLALPRLLETRHAFRARTLERVIAGRAALAAALAPCGARLLPAAGGWSAVLRLPNAVSADRLSLSLLDRDVVVHPGHFYDFDDDAHLVLSMIVEPATLAQGAECIVAAIRAG